MFRIAPEMPDLREISSPQIGMEGISYNFSDISNFTTNFFSKVAGIISDRNMTPNLLPRSPWVKSVGILQVQVPTTLISFTVCAPAYIDKDLLPYVLDLKEALNDLSQIDKLMLQPMELWLAQVLSNADTLDKAWINIPDNLKGAEYHNEKLMGYFNSSVANGIHDQTFIKLYGTIDNYKTCFTEVEALVKVTAEILSSKIAARATNITKLIYKVTNNTGSLKDKLKSLPPEKLTQLHDFVLNAAKGLELLSVCLFQVKLVAYAQQCTVEKINKQLS